MADDQEQKAVGVAVELVLGQLPLHRVHALAGQVAVDLNLETWQLLCYVTIFPLKVSTKIRGYFHIIFGTRVCKDIKNGLTGVVLDILVAELAKCRTNSDYFVF